MVVRNIKSIILGAYGMLGHELQHAFANAECSGRELDITDKDKVTRTIKVLNPDVVINAAAYTDEEDCSIFSHKSKSV